MKSRCAKILQNKRKRALRAPGAWFVVLVCLEKKKKNYEPPAPPQKPRIRFDFYTFSHHWAARSPEYILFSILSAAAAPNSFSFLYFRDQQPLNTFRFLYFPQPLLPSSSSMADFNIAKKTDAPAVYTPSPLR